MIFNDPWILILIPFVGGLLCWWHHRQRQPSVRFPSLELVSSLAKTWKVRFHPVPFYLRLITAVLFLVALGRPRAVLEETEYKTEGIDIVLAVDASSSMKAEDFKINGRRYNRLNVVKRVVNDFIDGRPHDRLGLIAFAGRAYTVSPLTTDHEWLKMNLERITLDQLEDGTAVGSAIGSSLSRLKNSPAKSRVIILLTDGVNNAGKLDPITAAQAAQALGVKIYTIGAGSKGYVPYPDIDIWGRPVYRNVIIDINEELLKQIAEITDGRYFRATNTESLQQIYDQIDALEKTEIEETAYREYRELFGIFLLGGLLVLLLEVILANTLLLKVP